MTIRTFYNEIDPYCCAWLSNLMDRELIRPGTISDKSISDLSPDEVDGYDVAHFFAGIGVWDHALSLSGYDPNGRVTWTGSCPCQSFSVAGKQRGKDDERHLWPEWFRLIRECRPDVVFGEQVEGAIRHGWLDDVQTDMEREAYRVGAVVLPAAGFGAPHIRSRLWFVADRLADAGSARLPQQRGGWNKPKGFAANNGVGRMADSANPRREWWRTSETSDERDAPRVEPERLCDAGGMSDSDGGRSQARRETTEAARYWDTAVADGRLDRPGPTNGFWRDADWLGCRDGKWRPVEPDTFPLASGAPARVGRLRAYGNAICAEVAAEFIAAYLDGI